MSHHAERTALEEDMRRLRRLLDRTVGAEHGGPSPLPHPGAGGISILDIACGRCDEAGTLAEFFQSLRPEVGHPPPPTLLVGTDVRQREIDEARERFRSGATQVFEFFRSDASRLGDHRQLRDDFDVLFFRHQNLYHGRTLWQRIFEEGLARLKDDGLLLFTSYFDREHTLALQAFENLGVEIVTTMPNPESRPLGTPGKSVDRHLAVLRKRRGHGERLPQVLKGVRPPPRDSAPRTRR